MADVDLSTLHAGATLGTAAYAGLVHYLLKKRDMQIDSNTTNITTLEIGRAKDRYVAAKEYATKESLRCFIETQETNRDNITRVRGEIKNAKTVIKKTNSKLDSMKDAIMAKLDKAF